MFAIKIGDQAVVLMDKRELNIVVSLISRFMDEHGRRPPIELIERWVGEWDSKIDLEKSGVKPLI